MNRLLAAALLLPLMTSPLSAETPKPPPERFQSIAVFGDDPCPRSSDEEIVVCARLPESERYRVPKALREKKKDDSGITAWSNRVAELETVSRIGTPNSCSPVGSGGFTGCYQQLMSKWRAERALMKQEAEEAP